MEEQHTMSLEFIGHTISIEKIQAKKMIMHAFKDFHFLELQDDNMSNQKM